jgi:hypothetical protein
MELAKDYPAAKLDSGRHATPLTLVLDLFAFCFSFLLTAFLFRGVYFPIRFVFNL